MINDVRSLCGDIVQVAITIVEGLLNCDVVHGDMGTKGHCTQRIAFGRSWSRSCRKYLLVIPLLFRGPQRGGS
jgi:hypothetical protein